MATALLQFFNYLVASIFVLHYVYQAFEDSTTYCSFKGWPFRVFAFDKILDYERLILATGGSHIPGSDGARVRSILNYKYELDPVSFMSDQWMISLGTVYTSM